MSERAPAESVGEADLSPPHDLCPVCGAWDSRSIHSWLQSAPGVALLACDACFALSASRFPGEAYLKALYAPDHYASDLLSSQRAVTHCGAHIAARIPADPNQHLRVLDYGGGDGALSRAFKVALRARGHRGRIECTVVDYFVDQRSDPEIRFKDVAELAGMTERFDIVLASAVLEHLTDLPTTARKLLSLCETGGFFYARTPHEAPLAAVVPGYPIRWPRHVHDLGPRFWAGFLPQMGYHGAVLHSAPSVVETDFASRPLRTFLAHLLKAPGRLEAFLLRDRVAHEGKVLWPFVGGWEVVLRVEGPVV